MYQIILMFHVIIAIFLIVMVLIQQGKGAEMGAAFGSGASATVFGSHGVGGFLFKLTGGLALLFFVTSLSLSYIVSSKYKVRQNVMPKPITQPHSNHPVPIPADNQKP